MQENRSTVTYLLIIAIALGLIFEVLKGFRKSHLSDRKAPALVLDANVAAFHVSDNEMKAEEMRARGRNFGNGRSSMHLNNISDSNKPQSYDFSGGKVAAAAAIDPKLQKKKKKKKKKEDEKKTEVAKTTPVAPVYADPTPVNSNDDVATGGASRTPGQLQPDTQNPAAATVGGGGLLMSYADWKKLLLASPSKTNVNKLLQYYKANLVTAQTFYQLLNDMSSTGNADQQNLALYAASAEISARSFDFLVTALKTDSANAAVISADEQDITAYQSLTNVSLLKTVFTSYSNDATVVQVAAQVLATSTSTYLNSRSVATAGTASAPTTAQLSHAYLGFTAILEQLITTYQSNTQITSLLQQSLTALKSAGIN